MSITNKEPMAFPSFVEQFDFGLGKEMPKSVAYGMTLRDYFAAKAMQALITGNHRTGKPPAEMAYDIADQMLKAREA